MLRPETTYIDLTTDEPVYLWIKSPSPATAGGYSVVGNKQPSTMCVDIECIPNEHLYNRLYEETTEEDFLVSCAHLLINRGKVRINKSLYKQITKLVKSDKLLDLLKSAERY